MSNERCPVCGQKLDSDITGEYPCQSCGLPTTHDKPEPEEQMTIKCPCVNAKVENNCRCGIFIKA
jgi:ferredoxin-thioredoxin reductase catalytic subunit